MAEEGHIHIRPLQPETDAKPMLQLHKFSKAAGRPVFGKPQLAAVEDVLNHPHCVSFCALVREHPSGDSEQLVGAVLGCASPQAEGACLEIISCVVRADFRGRGLGKTLVAALLSSTGSEREHMSSTKDTAAAAPSDLQIPKQQQPSSVQAAEAHCWVPRAHPLSHLLSKHFGFEPLSAESGTSQGAPDFALPGSQLLAKPLLAARPAAPLDATSTAGAGVGGAAAATAAAAAAHDPPQLHPHAPTQLVSEGAGGGVAVRRITEDDVEAALALHQAAELEGKPVFPDRLMPTLELMLELAAQGLGGIIGLLAVSAAASATTQEDTILGVAVGEQDKDDGNKFALLTLVVRPEAQRQGVGRQLLLSIVNEAKQLGAPQLVTDVARLNQPAISFFRQQGLRAERGNRSEQKGGFGGGTPQSKKGRSKKDRGKGEEAPLSVVLGMDLDGGKVSSASHLSPVQGAGHPGGECASSGSGSKARTSAVCTKPARLRPPAHLGARLPQSGQLNRTSHWPGLKVSVIRRVGLCI